jgi:hypothetical protein
MCCVAFWHLCVLYWLATEVALVLIVFALFAESGFNTFLAILLLHQKVLQEALVGIISLCETFCFDSYHGYDLEKGNLMVLYSQS